MTGWVAPTDFDWYSFLLAQGTLEEVNFWRPSSARRFHGEPFTPFFFKLKKPHYAICGFGLFARYTALPTWLAWDTFGRGNGCESEAAMIERIGQIRKHIDFRSGAPVESIGCILLVSPVFFPRDQWIPQPKDWPSSNLVPMRYDLTQGEGARIWTACKERVGGRVQGQTAVEADRYGEGVIVHPRLGQGTFRIAVTDAYERACSITGEHSLPALEAAHIRPYADSGPHEISNGLLLRADFHRLFDQGYVTVTPDLHVEVSKRLREDFQNGRTYYPFHGAQVRMPTASEQSPRADFLEWHNLNKFRG